MTINLDHILIFKTNILTAQDKLVVAEVLDVHREIEKWTVDCQDIDCVLRIVSPTLSAAEICGIIEELGYLCDEM